MRGGEGGAVSKAGEILQRALLRQADRAFLWLVVAFGGGITLFFAWTKDPPAWTGAGIVAVGLFAFATGRRVFGIAFAAAIVMAIGLGHSAAQLRTWAVGTPLLEHETRPFMLSAVVTDAEKRPDGNRIILSKFQLPNIAPAAAPERLRITVPASHGIPAVGERITVRAVVRPAAVPVMPDGFQFQRFLYFGGIGGVGYSVGRWQAEGSAENLSLAARFHAWAESLRRTIGDRITGLLPGADGAVAAALVSGEQSAIPEDLQEAYRVAGIAHLLSISGVHMSLLAAVVFFVVRRLIALIPFIALRIDGKKVAAWLGLGTTAFYLVISGMSIPAVRSFLMIAVVMVAILLDRTALSVRTIGWAALAVMALFPDAVFGASFQMSFLAVLALVALYEQTWLRIAWRGVDGQFRILRAVGLYIAGLVVTDFVAGGTTSLFAAYHFNRLPTYSAVTNLVAVPLTGLWIMPAAILGLLLMPLGWDEVPLKVMGAGVTLLDDVARTVAKWPGAQIHVPPMEVWALALATLGVVFICLWRGQARWLGLVAVLPAMLQPYLTPPPDILVDDTARVFAVSDAGGHLVIKPGRVGRFVREAWTDRYGTSPVKWPADLTCDGDGCILAREGQKALLAFTPAALAEDCGAAEITVSVIASHDLCREGRIVDVIDLRRDGAVAVWLTKDGVRTRSVADSTGDRVWMRGISPDDTEAPDDLEP